MGANGRLAALEVLQGRAAGRWPDDGDTRRGLDAIVLGAGHNGLVAAAYLARAGRSVLVVERRERVGGAADTAELAPGARVPAVAHTVGRLRPSVARELDLEATACELIAPDVRAFAPQPDGRPWRSGGTSRPPGRRCAPGPTPTRRLPGVRRGGCARSRGSSPTSATRPRPMSATRVSADALMGLRLGRTFRGLGREDGRTILRVLAMAIADYVAESFESDPIRATIAWRGVRHTAMGPWSAGTTKVLLDDAAGSDGGASGETVFARGGPGALADALASAARAAGAEIRTGVEVVAVTSDADGRATGIALASGEEIDGPRDRRRRRPEAPAHDARGSGGDRAEPALARRQHPHAGVGRPRSISSSTASRRSRRRPRTRACCAVGSSWG